MYMFTAGGGGATLLTITVNGIDIMAAQSVAATQYGWSSSALLSNEGATKPDGASVANTVAPYGGATYYASAGDVVSYTLGTTAAAAMNIQLVGTEVDV
jgi:hypothetical protein